jgi:uncharacterized membrane protein
MSRHFVLLVLVGTALAWAGGPASAQPFRPSLKFCNRTLSDVRVATAYDLEGTNQITSRGWFNVRACTCRTIIDGVALRATEVFLLANRGGVGNVLTDARAPICMSPSRFEFRDQNANAQACSAAGGQFSLYKMYDTRGTAHRVNLRRAGECNLMGDQ